jgi:hypothetical protein
MRFEPAINAGVVHGIYVGGATASMGSLQNFSTQHKTRNQEFLGSICRSFSEFLLPVAACPCLLLSVSRHVKKVRGYWFLRFLCYWKLSRLPEGPLYTMINILAISLPSFFTSSVSSCEICVGSFYRLLTLNRPACVHHRRNGLSRPDAREYYHCLK